MMRFGSDVVACAGFAVGLALGASALGGIESGGFTLGDLDYWVGAGANEAALVIDWNGPDGADPVSLAWGFRWDGVATGQDMLEAVINADENLYARFAGFGFGDVIIGLGYDIDSDGFAVSDGTDFGPTGLAFAGTSDGATATDGDDYYAEGWNTGFWAYAVGEGDPFDGGAWGGTLVGFGDRVLSDGDWDGYRFAPGFVSDDPRLPTAAVPGVGSGVVLVGAFACARRRRNADG